MTTLLPDLARHQEARARTPLIALRGVSRVFGEGATAVTALDAVDLDIHQGEFVALLGPSGSGKTTLMNLIGLLDRPSSGSYALAGEEVGTLDSDALAAVRRERIGFIFQQYSLIPTLSAVENVALPALYAGLSGAERHMRAADQLGRLGLAERLGHRPTQLSGGQQQRVSIARALMNGGDIILADEPTGALDSRTGAEVMAILHELHRAGHTIILVTHAEELAEQAERQIRLRDGRIVSDSGAVPTIRESGDRSALPKGGAPRALDTLRTATRALGANILRTALTLLGIVIGIASVIIMLAIGNGEKEAMLQRLSHLGPDLLTITAGARNVRSADGVTATLIDADRAAITGLPNVRAAISEYSTTVTLRGAGNDLRTSAQATTPDLPQVRNWALARGSFFGEAEIARYAAVAVLGQTVARNLFGDDDPLGRYVLVNTVPFQVIGLLEPRGANSWGRDQDDVLFVPLSTASLRLHGQRHVQSITVQVADTRQVDATQEAVTALLAERHGAIDFQVRNTAQILATVTASRDGATAMLGAIALVSLLVGGIGVMNIMLVSVTERTREIGLRMAVGARRRDVLRQFSLEALMICTAGGLVGAAIGLAGTAVLEALAWPIVVEPITVVLALASACLTGLAAGYLPARKAAGLDPVRALANE